MATTDFPLNQAVEILKLNGAQLGSGILIGPSWVLTAAHLNTELHGGYCESVRVKHAGGEVGADWWAWEDTSIDLALLRLENAVSGAPVAIEPSALEVGTKGKVAGYGEAPGSFSIRDFNVALPLCEEHQSKKAYGCVGGVDIVIQGVNPNDLIHGGDSGAPYCVQLNGHLQLAGIVTRHAHPQPAPWIVTVLRLCGLADTTPPVTPDGNCTRLDLQMDWIKKALERKDKQYVYCPPTYFYRISRVLHRKWRAIRY